MTDWESKGLGSYGPYLEEFFKAMQDEGVAEKVKELVEKFRADAAAESREFALFKICYDLVEYQQLTLDMGFAARIAVMLLNELDIAMSVNELGSQP